MPEERFSVDMIVKALSQGFDKVTNEVSELGKTYEKTAQQISKSSGQVGATTGKAGKTISDSSKTAGKDYEEMSRRMASASAMAQQKTEALAASQKKLEKAVNIATVAIGAAGVAVIAFIASATQMAARVETLGIVTARMGQNVGMTEQEIRDLEKSVASQGITMRSAREAIALMIQANIDLKNATELATLAQNAAVITGNNSSETFRNLTYAISSGSIIMLRRMQLSADFENAYKREAAAMGKSTLALTEQEKIQIRTNEVLLRGKNILGVYEAAMETAGKKVASLARHVEDSRVALGEAWLPLYADVIDLITNSLKAWEGLNKETQASISISLGLGASWMVLFAGLSGAIKVIQKASVAIAEMNAGMGVGAVLANSMVLPIAALAAVLIGLAYAGWEVNRSGKEFTKTLEEAAKQGHENAETFSQYKQIMINAYLANEQVSMSMKSWGLTAEQMAAQAWMAVEGTSALTEAEWTLDKIMKDRDQNTRDYADSLLVAMTASQRLYGQERLLPDALYENAKAAMAAAQGYRDLRRQWELTITIADALKAGLSGQLTNAMESNAEVTKKLAEDHRQLTEDLAEETSKAKQDKEKIEELTVALAENEAEQRDAATALAETTAQMLYQQLAADLDTRAALELARSMGVLSEADYAAATAVASLRAEYDQNRDGAISAGEGAMAFAEDAEILAGVIENLTNAGMEVTLENIAAGLAVVKDKGSEALQGLIDDLPDTVSDFDELNTKIAEGETKAEEAFGTMGIEAEAASEGGVTNLQETLTEMDVFLNDQQAIMDYFGSMNSEAAGSVGKIGEVQAALAALPLDKHIAIYVTTYESVIQRADGGPLIPGVPTVVGERGPEMIIPSSGGYVVPNEIAFPATRPGLSGRDRSVLSVQFDGDQYYLLPQDVANVQMVTAMTKKQRLTDSMRA